MDCLSGWRSWQSWDAEIASKNFGHSNLSRAEWTDECVRPYVTGFDRSAHDLSQRRQQTFHFLHRVVVDQADAQEASQALYV
jgi:hypothetical protein